MMIRPSGGFHGGHMGGQGIAGGWGGGHVRVGGGGWNGGSAGGGYGHVKTALPNGYGRHFAGFNTRYGHVNTAAPNGVVRRYAGYGLAGRAGYGHVATGFGRLRSSTRYALQRGRDFGYGGYGGYGEDDGYGGYSGGGVYGAGGYGGGAVYAAGGDSGSYGTTRTGYQGDEAGGYAEPPLNAIGSGGPQILVVGGGHRAPGVTCTCTGQDGAGPVVYRFGVGSYY